MHITLKFSGNIYNLMRQLGYHPHETEESSSYVRRLGSSDYPRFHIYTKVARETPRHGSGQALELNLHLDQKKPSYQGTTAHSGEHDGKLVEKEAERVKQIAGS